MHWVGGEVELGAAAPSERTPDQHSIRLEPLVSEFREGHVELYLRVLAYDVIRRIPVGRY